MTVKEMLDQKYRTMVKTMSEVQYRLTKERVEKEGKHMAQVMYKAVEITANDIRDNGGWTGELWKEIDAMHKAGLLASNKHRQYHGQVTKYWLTEKGWKAINKDHAIC